MCALLHLCMIGCYVMYSENILYDFTKVILLDKYNAYEHVRPHVNLNEPTRDEINLLSTVNSGLVNVLSRL